MPFTTPPTFISGDVLTAAQLNILGDDLTYLNGVASGLTFSAVQVTRVATQSIATSNDENVSFDNENYDYGSWWSSGTTVTVPAGAIPTGFTTIGIDVDCLGRFASNATGKRRIELLKNGASFETFKIVALDDDATTVFFSAKTTVAAGDTIKMNVWQNSGGALNLTLARLSVTRIGPAA